MMHFLKILRRFTFNQIVTRHTEGLRFWGAVPYFDWLIIYPQLKQEAR